MLIVAEQVSGVKPLLRHMKGFVQAQEGVAVAGEDIALNLMVAQGVIGKVNLRRL